MGMSRRAYARHRGCNERTVRRAIEDGRIAAAMGPDGIDPHKADALWEANTSRPPDQDAVADGTKKDDTARKQSLVTDLTRARIGKLELDKQKAELSINAMRGKLIDREAACRAVFAFFRRERDAWLSWPSRIAPNMAAELRVDDGRLQRTLKEYVEDHLRELADTEPTLE